jgi:hypothetical protein
MKQYLIEINGIAADDIINEYQKGCNELGDLNDHTNSNSPVVNEINQLIRYIVKSGTRFNCIGCHEKTFLVWIDVNESNITLHISDGL